MVWNLELITHLTINTLNIHFTTMACSKSGSGWLNSYFDIEYMTYYITQYVLDVHLAENITLDLLAVNCTKVASGLSNGRIAPDDVVFDEKNGISAIYGLELVDGYIRIIDTII
jgi:hypothetical protein